MSITNAARLAGASGALSNLGIESALESMPRLRRPDVDPLPMPAQTGRGSQALGLALGAIGDAFAGNQMALSMLASQYQQEREQRQQVELANAKLEQDLTIREHELQGQRDFEKWRIGANAMLQNIDRIERQKFQRELHELSMKQKQADEQGRLLLERSDGNTKVLTGDALAGLNALRAAYRTMQDQETTFEEMFPDGMPVQTSTGTFTILSPEAFITKLGTVADELFESENMTEIDHKRIKRYIEKTLSPVVGGMQAFSGFQAEEAARRASEADERSTQRRIAFLRAARQPLNMKSPFGRALKGVLGSLRGSVDKAEDKREAAVAEVARMIESGELPSGVSTVIGEPGVTEALVDSVLAGMSSEETLNRIDAVVQEKKRQGGFRD